ncbi:MAG: Fe(3+) ABC transporter substrate-binding protein [Bacteroidota bacterium]
MNRSVLHSLRKLIFGIFGIFGFLVIGFSLTSCGGETVTKEDETTEAETPEKSSVTVYTHRHYDVDKEIFKDFTEKTGVEVEVLFADASQILERLEQEGEKSPADLVFTVDAKGLVQVKQKDLLQSIESEKLNENIPAKFRDADGYWYGLTYRGRIVVYDKDRVDPTRLSTYQNLTAPEWEDRILVRSSSNVYNRGLLSSMITLYGKEAAQNWAKGLVINMARAPKGNDRAQVRGIAEGVGDLAIINTYYMGLLKFSEDSTERASVENIGVFFPNQDSEGAHINLSMAGVAKHAPNKAGAVALLEYLSTKEVQEKYANANFEYPVNQASEPHELLKSWGDFKTQTITVEEIAEKTNDAVAIFQQANWK